MENIESPKQSSPKQSSPPTNDTTILSLCIDNDNITRDINNYIDFLLNKNKNTPLQILCLQTKFELSNGNLKILNDEKHEYYCIYYKMKKKINDIEFLTILYHSNLYINGFKILEEDNKYTAIILYISNSNGDMMVLCNTIFSDKSHMNINLEDKIKEKRDPSDNDSEYNIVSINFSEKDDAESNANVEYIQLDLEKYNNALINHYLLEKDYIISQEVDEEDLEKAKNIVCGYVNNDDDGDIDSELKQILPSSLKQITGVKYNDLTTQTQTQTNNTTITVNEELKKSRTSFMTTTYNYFNDNKDKYDTDTNITVNSNQGININEDEKNRIVNMLNITTHEPLLANFKFNNEIITESKV